jgi:YihY family inner membrane protein
VSATTSNALATGRRLLSTARDSQLGFLAAGIAYYAFVSFVPFALLALSAASLVGGEAFSREAVAALSGVLTPEATGVVEDALRLDAAAGGATVLGTLVLAWSSLRLFRGLDTAFSTVYGTAGELTLVDKLRDGAVVLGSILVGVLAVGLAGLAVVRFGGVLVPGLATAALVVALAVVLLPMFAVFPDADVGIAGAWPGAALAAVGWTALGGAFQAYAGVASTSVYGVLGGAVLFVTWLYFGALLLLLGAALNATLDGVGPAEDRNSQHPGLRQSGPTAMAESDDDRPEAGRPDLDPEEAEAVRTELDRLWEELESVEGRLDEKTVSRSEFEREMKRYVRRRQRRGHARGWGPYLVLGYGTVMTLGAFFYLNGAWAILAMLVVWLSTLGLYALMVLLGTVFGGLSALGRVRDAIGSLRS